MTKPTTLKDWEFVKDQKNDISRLIQKGYRPDDYYYQCDNGIYTPSVRVIDWEEHFKNKKA
jgi:hypothetical protein